MPTWQLRKIRRDGAKAEKLALCYLKQQGLRLVAHNFACRQGEVDLVMLDYEVLVFIEVRFRASQAFGGALSSITPAKQQKVRKAAAQFIQRHKVHALRHCRFDTITITPNDDSRQNRLEWIKGAF
ncbi:YraN family protein [Candidatus Sororendozoicomonas aggregata]|uniref:YraN family protein n=1 Tax=Candidatus Sororendozoicomonas aggregata TaxID=3073239 RepID=UPI002ED1A1B6